MFLMSGYVRKIIQVFGGIWATILGTVILTCWVSCAPAGVPLSYYDAADLTTSSSLKGSLSNIVTSGSHALGYDNTWDPIRFISESPTSPSAVQIVYGGVPRDKFAGSNLDSNPLTGGWNREHAFPQSFFSQEEPMRSDLHALFPADSDLNSRRNNSPYDIVTSPTYTDALGNRATGQLFEPADVDKGMVARAIFYMDVRYAGAQGEPDLRLVNSYPAGTGGGEMAFQDTLLAWHRAYPPTAFERSRNNKTFVYQSNANPFIDHPEWVGEIYGGQPWEVKNGDILTVAADSAATTTVFAGTVDLPVLILPTQTEGQEVHIVQLRVHNTGTLSDSHIKQVKLWYDADSSGMVSPADTLLGSSVFNGGMTTITLAHSFAMDSGFNQLLLTTDLSLEAPTSSVLQVTVPPEGLDISVSGGQDSVASFEEARSNGYPVNNPLDGVANLLISEVFEGTQANLKYVEIYNPTSVTVSLARTSIQLRRYTNGGAIPGLVPLGVGDLPAGGFYVVANNAADFEGAFGFAPNAVTTEISHNGNDCYDLYQTTTSMVLDTFAGDRIGDASNFATDRVAHRMIHPLPNQGQWGLAAGIPSDNSLSPSGYWSVRTVSAGNANAGAVGSPGRLTEQHSAVDNWADY